MSIVELNRPEGEQSLEVHPSDTIVVRLQESPSTGYQWSAESSDDDTVRLVASEFTPVSGLPGSGGERMFSFTTLRIGVARLELKLWRTWEGSGSEKARFVVNITVRE